MKCIIIDDEPLARKGLEKYVAMHPQLEWMESFGSCKEALMFLKYNHVDLLLLDIHMPQMSGIEMLQKLTIQPIVILITANAEYAHIAYNLDVIDYLIKPVLYERFEKAITKAIDFADITQQKKKPQSVFVKVNGVYKKIYFNEIRFIQAMSNYIAIHTEDARHIVYQSIKSMEAELAEHNFLRVHKSYIVNCASIQSFTNHIIKIKNADIRVGRNYKESFKNNYILKQSNVM